MQDGGGDWAVYLLEIFDGVGVGKSVGVDS